MAQQDPEFTPAEGPLSWVTPAILRQVRDDDHVGVNVREGIDTLMEQAREEGPDSWPDTVRFLAASALTRSWFPLVVVIAMDQGLVAADDVRPVLPERVERLVRNQMRNQR